MFWFFLFCSSLLLQITLLNLIIAVMGDTQDRVMEVAQEAKLKEICSFISEYYDWFPKDKIYRSSQFLIVSQEGTEGKKGASWEGKVGALKKMFRQQLVAVENRLTKMNEILHNDGEKCTRGMGDIKEIQEKNQEGGKRRVKEVGSKQGDVKERALEMRA